MRNVLFALILIVGGAAAAWASGAHEPTVTINAAHPAGTVSPIFTGLMTEAINHSYDGGLYAELIRNRAFLDNPTAPSHWSVVQQGSAKATIALDSTHPLDKAIPTSLKLDVKSASPGNPAGIANGGYWGIAVRPNTQYTASFYAEAAPGFSGPVTLALVSDDGTKTYAHGTVSGLSQGWKQYHLTLTTGSVETTSKARFVLTVDHPGTLWVSLVSLFPPTFDNQANGFRPDIMKMLTALKPKFLRFPGGNFLEGHTIAQRFNWKKTIGPLRDRPGHNGPWGYRSTDGMGLLEFLLWAQDMHAQPVLAIYAGYSLDGQHVKPGKDLEPYVKSALEEIQYVTGPVTSKWGAVRARDGHPKPFPLHYVEIGNEDFFDRSGSYNQRFTQFYKAIKAEYPKIQVISTIGTDQPTSKRVTSVTPDVLDEHYYRWAYTFIQKSPTHFKDYKRTGPKIFVGEWASYETAFPPWNPQSRQEPPTPNMTAALGDAAWMTAMIRNSNLVIMQAYAPLLVNVNPGARQWRPDLIGYNALHVFGSPSYYAIRMFSRNLGDQILAVTHKNTKVQSAVTRDSSTGVITVDMVNPRNKAAKLRIHIEGGPNIKRTAEVITMAAKPDATNSITDRTAVVPKTTTFHWAGRSFTYHIPANAIVVLKLSSR